MSCSKLCLSFLTGLISATGALAAPALADTAHVAFLSARVTAVDARPLVQAPQTASARRIVRKYGSVEIATRDLDLRTLAPADFGDEMPADQR